ncbi:adhesion G-protein coupled receptor G2-like isoform X3 [Lates japonicus]|uniref:Adhesion G-protein coupled receptor G2-like isoform X3 n=1 Tax=Lates japonicus TaxID=270547 RepID=A0AAD3M9Z6_LATJO|nr:adhesion G-protein coupled receptor G2-like isoform X3 [Lates japonicus]
MADLAASINGSSAALSAGEGVTGILVKETQPEDKGIPRCHSWNGEGSRPNWTEDGCLTVNNGSNITCQCSHLTFFAILLTPLNETISSSDLSNLTIITQVGCGLSIFFLSIVLFMHFLIRKTKATKTTRILIHLVSAMLLLNFTFLINNFVAKLKSSVGCKIMAALMHYFMLATFTWFAAQAFHICLQLYTGGQIAVHRYILKVSITSWLTPSVVGIVLLIIGKYGEQIIYTDDPADNVAMCWITDNEVHYIVNIGYYSLVFLFTFISFIITLSWLFCLRRTKAATQQVNRNGRSIVTIMGLCCMLGITWGFAFFAYGILLIPSYYIFTVLNSFQGFFLFIYYYKTSHSGGTNSGRGGDKNSASTSSVSTLKTGLDLFENPYCDPPNKK